MRDSPPHEQPVSGSSPSGDFSRDFVFGRFVVQSATRRLLVDGEAAKLGARAFDVLMALIERRDRVVGKNELLDLVWPGLVVEENNLQVQISTLRKLLGPQAIATIPGRGYRFSQKVGGASQTTAESIDAASESVHGPEFKAPPVPLLGREDDLNELETLIFAHRIVTVVGAGGIGKTTVARAIAHRIRGAFDDGSCIADLAPVSDPSLVAMTVATALQVKLGNRSPVEAITQALAGRRMLVVLDNCEHLLQAVAGLLEALDPLTLGAHWLATSQEPLKVAGEQVFPIRALALPAEETLDAARRAGAVALFEARARAADPRFALTVDNVVAVIDICRQLDGIALAIELAAARVPLLGIEGLRRRLGERLNLLTSGNRLALPRHQTLRDALEWSHGLLSPPQQAVFRRLSVFVGIFALEAVQQVAADESIDEWAVLDALGSLVDKSLVVAEPQAGEPRYRLLETMRQYALEQLEASGEGDAVRGRHLDLYVALAEQAKNGLLGPEQGRLMRRLELELENVLEAHAWCSRAAGGGERDLRLVTGLYRYWLNRALLSLGYRLTQEALRRHGAEGQDRLRSEALTQAGNLGGRIGLFGHAMQAHDEAIAIARELGAPELLAEALTRSGSTRVEQGDLAGARVQMEEAFALSRQVGAESEPFGRATLALGELERLEGHFTRAQLLYEASLAQARQRGDLHLIGFGLVNLVMTAIAQGRTAGVRERLLEAVALYEQTIAINRYGRVFPLILCAGLAALRGDWELSARFEGAATFHFAKLEWPLDPPDRAYVQSVSARTRAALGNAAFERSLAQGRGLSLDDALAQMRQYLNEQS